MIVFNGCDFIVDLNIFSNFKSCYKWYILY